MYDDINYLRQTSRRYFLPIVFSPILMHFAWLLFPANFILGIRNELFHEIQNVPPSLSRTDESLAREGFQTELLPLNHLCAVQFSNWLWK